MPRIITEEQKKEFEKSQMNLSLGSILSWKDVQKYAEEKLYDSRFLPDIGPPLPSTSKVTILVSNTSMNCDSSGVYILELSTTIYPHERIHRSPGSGQPVYFNDTLLGQVKNTSLHETQGDACFMELQLEYLGRDSLFLRMLRAFGKFEATIDSAGIHFGSGADFEDLVKVTIEEEKRRELRDVIRDPTSWKSFSLLR